MRHTTALLLVLGLATMAIADEKAFVSLSFGDALKQAEKEKKLVFVDFYATWCGPCKVLDKTTLADASVVSWLRENTVALKIDAEREPALAARYRISAFPTLVFMKPDGAEVGRLQGVVQTDHFLSEAKGIRAGKNRVERARDRLESNGPDDPHERMQFARELAGSGKFDEALEHYLWCWDKGNSKSRSFAGVRVSFLLQEIAELGRQHSPAMQALRERRDRAREEVLALEKPNWLSRMLTRPNTPAADFVSLNAYLAEDDKSLDLYDELKENGTNAYALRQIRPHVYDLLREAKRYHEIAEHKDILGDARRRIEMDEQSTRFMPEQQREQMIQWLRGRLLNDIADDYEVLIGSGMHSDADKLAKLLIDFYDNAQTYNALAWAGYLTGRPTKANLEQAEKANTLTNGNSAAIVDTLARVLDARGQNEQACQHVREALNWLPAGRDRDIVQETAEDLACPSAD